MPLTDLEIKYATLRKRPYQLFDGQGLYLLVQPGGTKLWRLKYHFDGKEKVLNFWKYPEVAAAVARQKRNDAKAKLKEGVDPGVSLARRDAPTTFEPIARAWHANRAESLDAAHASRVIRRMERDAFPWRISPERMKMEREHLVPLSSRVSEMLLRRKRMSNDRFVFPGEKPGQPISENTMIYACYRMGCLGKHTVHGFRGLGSKWANEAECYRPDWVEMALAHVDEDEVRGAYNSALYLTPRRRMLQDWADHLDGNIGPAGNNGRAALDRSTLSRNYNSAPMKPRPDIVGRPMFWQRPRMRFVRS